MSGHLHERTQGRTARLGPTPLELQEIVVSDRCYFKPLSFGAICYVAIDNWNLPYIFRVSSGVQSTWMWLFFVFVSTLNVKYHNSLTWMWGKCGCWLPCSTSQGFLSETVRDQKPGLWLPGSALFLWGDMVSVQRSSVCNHLTHHAS